MAARYENLYRELGRLLETMPNLNDWPTTREAHIWFGRAYALVKDVGNGVDAALFQATLSSVGTVIHEKAISELIGIVYRALAIAEREAPPGTGGAFIPVGNSFDAFAALAKLLQGAGKDVLIVDPYMDEAALTEFGTAVPQGVALRLMADSASVKSTLQPAGVRWVQQHGAARPLNIRFASPKTLHDRALFVDGTNAWTLTQSLKDFAKRSPAEIVRADDTAALKIAAYEAIWQNAQVII